MLHLFDDYLHARNLRDWLILFRDIDDQIILQSDWIRDRTGPTQPYVIILELPFFHKLALPGQVSFFDD